MQLTNSQKLAMLLAVSAILLGSVSAEPSVGVDLNSFCKNGASAVPVGFIHDDDGQRVTWIYTCADQSQGVVQTR